MGWWGHHTNEGDTTQDYICDMVDALNIKNSGFCERINKITEKMEEKKLKNDDIDNDINKDIDGDINEDKKTDIDYDEENIDNTENDKETEQKDEINKDDDYESQEDEKANYFNSILKDEGFNRESDSEESVDNEQNNESASFNNTWWDKKTEIEDYVKKNLTTLSECSFIVAGIAWELFGRSPEKENGLPDDFPEDLRLLALESAKAYYEEMKITNMIEMNMTEDDNNECLSTIQEEIDVFSRKK